MEQKLRDIVYMEHNERMGVLRDNDKEKVSQVIGTDLTIVLYKQDGKYFLLVPLTKNHSFECKGDCLKVDGKRFESDNFFRKDGCQWIEIKGLMELEYMT